MPIAYRIDHARKLVWAVASGVIGPQEMFDYQREVWARDDVRGYDELVDMRQVASLPSPTPESIRKLAELSASMDPPDQPGRFAIVASDDLAFGLGRMYQTHRGLVSPGGKQVSVFRTLAAALDWLGQAGPDRLGPVLVVAPHKASSFSKTNLLHKMAPIRLRGSASTLGDSAGHQQGTDRP
jgi:hypothetical protein